MKVFWRLIGNDRAQYNYILPPLQSDIFHYKYYNMKVEIPANETSLFQMKIVGKKLVKILNHCSFHYVYKVLPTT